MMNKKLIEVAIPLEAINKQSSREKSIRHGHPSTLHLWWARRPLATARAVLFASLVDDPSSHPELFPTEEEENKERERLFKIIEKLIVWENSNNPAVLNESKAEIAKYVEGPIEFLDPFSGGGAIPLEAKRLGMNAHAFDLNPVAVTINRAMIDLPSRFDIESPINPDWKAKDVPFGSSANMYLADDVRFYGNLLKKMVWEKVKQHYPKYMNPDGTEDTVIAWLWTRTVKCPNPMCRCSVPMIKSTTLSTKLRKYVNVNISHEDVSFFVTDEKPDLGGTVISKRGGICPTCHTTLSLDYLYAQFNSGDVTPKMMAIVCESPTGRRYGSPNSDHIDASEIERPDDLLDVVMEGSNRDVHVRHYGMELFSDLFTNRQLMILRTFCDTLNELQDRIAQDALSSGIWKDEGRGLSRDGNEALAYAESVVTYLSFVIDKLADRNSVVCSWDSSRDGIRNTFGRQAIPMVWDYAESNPFSNSSGSFNNMLDWVVKCIQQLPVGTRGESRQHNAMEEYGMNNLVISSDPPYYDNIDYADLSDFFYVWMRMCLKEIYPSTFSTIKVPKDDELVALSHRHENNKERAKSFFEDGMVRALRCMYIGSREDVPVTIYYAFKQTEMEIKDESEQYSSSGWETFLNAVIKAGFVITGTWPMRTEMSNRMIGIDTNALSSSIVLVCRKQDHQKAITQREFISILKSDIKQGLTDLQNSGIAPVDLAQSAIGPGISVFSRYEGIIQSDGSKMSVKTALQVINRELDSFLNENESTMDSESRFCVELYVNYAYNELSYGDADILAKAKNVSIEHLKSIGVIYSEKGRVSLVERNTILENDDRSGKRPTIVWHLCQHLTALLEAEGINECAKYLKTFPGTLPGEAKSLAYRLFTIAEKKKWTQEAIVYNSLAASWSDIQIRIGQIIESESPNKGVNLDRWSS